MKQILLCGLQADHNFGCPSLLHGMGELLRNRECKLLNIQLSPVVPLSVSDLPFETRAYSIRAKRLLILTVLRKFGIAVQRESPEALLIDTIMGADCIIDLFGICFCDNFVKEGPVPALQLWKDTLGKFLIPYCGKLLGVKTIKNTASYGPMQKEASRKSACLAAKHIFDCFLAREAKSQKQFLEGTKTRKPVILSPDTANLMPPPPPLPANKRPVVLSVSHQILKQWAAGESYWDVMTALCRTISKKTDSKIILLPNEVEVGVYNDLSVAQELQKKIAAENIEAEVVDILEMNATQIKGIISSAEVVVASRYHSCVAALSSGVPLLVLGWHNKYEELLHCYGQDEWSISSATCTGELLSTRFLSLWDQRKALRDEIETHKSNVVQQVHTAFFQALAVVGVHL